MQRAVCALRCTPAMVLVDGNKIPSLPMPAVSIVQGDRGKRVFIGFGKGKGELKTHVEGYLTTARGHRLLGSREISSAGGKGPGLLLPSIVAVATANPVGLLVTSAVKIRSEKKGGSDTIKGAARRTAKKIAEELKAIFRKQGWI